MSKRGDVLWNSAPALTENTSDNNTNGNNFLRLNIGNKKRTNRLNTGGEIVSTIYIYIRVAQYKKGL